MAVDWVQIGVQTAFFVVILAGFLVVFRVLAVNWFKMAFVRFVKGLKQDAAAEGGSGTGQTSPSGDFSLGGFPIGQIVQLVSDPNVQKLISKFLTRGSGGEGW